MAIFRQDNGRIILWLRWLTRLTGLGLTLLVLAIISSEYLAGEPPLTWTDMTPAVILTFIALFAMVVGAVMAWRWEGIGGTLVLGGALLFGLVNSIGHDAFGAVIVEPAFTVVGALFVVCWWYTQRQ